MPTRRLVLLMPLAAAACGRREPEPVAALPPLVTGYGHLTPLRLNVAEVQVPEPLPGAVIVQGVAPLSPAQEMRRMAEERLIPAGASGQARFLVERARLLRERLPTTGGLAGALRTEQSERLTCDMLCRLDIVSADGDATAFIEGRGSPEPNPGGGHLAGCALPRRRGAGAADDGRAQRGAGVPGTPEPARLAAGRSHPGCGGRAAAVEREDLPRP
jgi:hypothetical protein